MNGDLGLEKKPANTCRFWESASVEGQSIGLRFGWLSDFGVSLNGIMCVRVGMR